LTHTLEQVNATRRRNGGVGAAQSFIGRFRRLDRLNGNAWRARRLRTIELLNALRECLELCKSREILVVNLRTTIGQRFSPSLGDSKVAAAVTIDQAGLAQVRLGSVHTVREHRLLTTRQHLGKLFRRKTEVARQLVDDLPNAHFTVHCAREYWAHEGLIVWNHVVRRSENTPAKRD
jgi:hypothetical protein